jgi:prephenate dehydratase
LRDKTPFLLLAKTEAKMRLKVAFQGEPGAYSEAAVLGYFGENISPIPNPSFEQAFTAVVSGECNFGVLPIENSLAGSIHRNYDLLLENNLHIVGEQFVRVKHCLIGLPGTTKANIKKVISHPQALAQCDHHLRALGVATEAVYDTAGSVRIVKDKCDPTLAAIASARAAQVYEMSILEDGIEDNPANYTRFLVLAREPVDPAGEAKTTLVFTLKNVAGALFKALSVFALRDIDLTKIESRPLPGSPWEYLFYIDFVGHLSDPNCARALDHLGEMATMLRVLGTYPRFHWNE